MALTNQQIKETFNRFVGQEFTREGNDPVMQEMKALAAQHGMKISVKYPEDPDMSFFTGGRVRFVAEYVGRSTKLRVTDSFSLR